MGIKGGDNSLTKKTILHKKNKINDVFNQDKKRKDSEQEEKIENITITKKSIVLFQVFLFIIYYLVLLTGSFNFSFKLFHVKEKHLYKFLNYSNQYPCANYLKGNKNNKNILYRNINKLVDSNDNLLNVNFKYYHTISKYPIKEESKILRNKKQVELFICLNKKKNFYYSDFYHIFFSSKKYVFNFLSFFYNEIKNAYIKKTDNNFLHNSKKKIEKNNLDLNLKFVDKKSEENVEKRDDIINKYLHYSSLLRNKNSYLNSYIYIESLFYIYLHDVCHLHYFRYMINKTNDSLLKSHKLYGKMSGGMYLDNERDIALLINHINRYLNDGLFVNILDNLYLDICKNEHIINYLQNKNDTKKGFYRNNNANLDSDTNKNIYNYDKETITKEINYGEYYILYNKIEQLRNINKYNTFINKLKKRIKTINILKSLNLCLKSYIMNLKKVPLNIFLNTFYDTPCYVYNQFIINLLRNYYKGVFLYIVIFIGCIHVVFSPFPITLVHFRRFFIYFLIMMYRLFILYFIPSMVKFIISKFNYFKKEYLHIFDYSDHIILFSTLLFIISLESKAIQYTINHQKQGSDYFHYKYNRKLCFSFLKLVLYYYYILIFFILYTSYFTSKYFHSTNEIFVAYFFSTFSIFFLFYFFLYKNYFSFYSIGITSYTKISSFTSFDIMHSASYLSIISSPLKGKISVD